MATKKKQRENGDMNGDRVASRIGLVFKIILLTVLLTTLGLFLWFYLKYGKTILGYQQEAKSLVWSSTEDTFRQYQTSIFFDSTGEVISSLSGEREMYYVQYEDMPASIVDAVVTIEDKRYFEHGGVDFIANVRAAWALIQNDGKVTQGGSTITQQLAKNVFLTNEVTVERKVKEIFIASELEKKYTKQQILEFYLNNIYYANGYYGIQAAAYGYLGKSISELSLSEAAFLTAIPNSPTLYNPVTNIDNTYKRRNKILKQMYEDGLITKKEYKAAKKEEIQLVEQTSTFHNYVETYVYECTIEALMKQSGFVFQTEFASDEEETAYKESYQEEYSYYQTLLYTGGYRVYTSIRLDKQEELQNAVDETLSSYTSTDDNGVYELQSAAVCIDNETGNVVAIVGGRSQDFSTYTFNRAYQSYRQPGSAIKPLVVYTPYFELGHSPEEIVVDEKFEDGPKNSNGIYAGEMTIRTAVWQSTNTIAWKIFEELTPSVGLSYLKEMNFKKVCKEDEVPAASLGGFTYGSNVLEMAAAYATLENDGVYRKPDCIVRITDATGNIILEPEKENKQVYDVEACRIMTDVMKGVLESGTGKGLGLGDMPAAAKTGTTNDKKDGWFVGYTRYYTTSVWVGYDYPKTLDNLTGNTYPGQIWNTFMEEIHEGLEPLDFEPYVDLWAETSKEELEEITDEELLDEETTEDEFEEEDTEIDLGVEEEPEDSFNEPTDEEEEDLPTSQPEDDSGVEDDGELEDDWLDEPEDEEIDMPEIDYEELEDDDLSEDEAAEDESDEVFYSNGQVYYKDVEESED